MIAESLPADLAGAHAMILAERAARLASEAGLVEARAVAVHAKADLTGTEALIVHLKLAIEKLRRALYGSRSERQTRLLDQMEFELEELQAEASEDEIAAQAAAAQAAGVIPLVRKRPSRRAPSRCICRASASSSPRRRSALAADRRGCRSSARM